jgi:hypothetical protein
MLMGADVAFSLMWVTTNGFKARTVVASATTWCTGGEGSGALFSAYPHGL